MKPGRVLPFSPSLAGLRGISVLVEYLTPEAEQAGLTRSAIQADAELKLRMAGIRVIDEDEAVSPRGPHIYIRVNCMKVEGKEFLACSTAVALNQNVRLARDPSVVIAAATWEKDAIGVAGSSQISDGVRGLLKDLVEEFITDYLAMNPKVR